uniref:Uncharacterized protein n=1 Tax=Anopheles christyi TaxID=43041 RepID=A0A182KIW2_9DIPT
MSGLWLWYFPVVPPRLYPVPRDDRSDQLVSEKGTRFPELPSH